MIKTFGEAAFSMALATAGLTPFWVGEWPEPKPDAQNSSEVQSQINSHEAGGFSGVILRDPAPYQPEKADVARPSKPVADANPVRPEPDSSDIPDLYAEMSREQAEREAFEAKVRSFAYQLRSTFGINPTRALNFSEWILVAVESTSIPKEIMAALVVSESSFRYKLRSAVGAVGPAQVRPVFWEEKCGSGDLENDPELNIRCGVTVLSEYLEKNCDGDMVCALQTYNVGPTNYHDPKFEGAKQRYISKIKRNMSKLTGYTVLASQ